MKRVVILVLVVSLVVSFTIDTKAKRKRRKWGRQIKIKFPSNKERTVNLNINPVEATQEFIHFQVKNPKHKRLMVKLDLNFKSAPELNRAIDYWVQDKKHNIDNFEHLHFNHQIRGRLLEIKGNYNGWIKIDFSELEDWWQVKAGSYQGRLKVSVKEHPKN